MTNPGQSQGAHLEEFEYLCVDAFLQDVVGARTVQAALELNLIDHLAKRQPCPWEDLKKAFKDEPGLAFLLNLLKAYQVIEGSGGEIQLSAAFTKALKYRDLLEAKLDLANFALPDFVNLFTVLIRSPEAFFREARVFGLFDYSKCFHYSPENYELTKRWVRITTILTRYEAQVCMKYHDFGQFRRMLDIGGNSGEFALRVCKDYPGISVMVFDLPLVCAIGQEHLRSESEVDRISFFQGNALTDFLPEGFDLVTFKSMLHDWPEREAKQLISRAARSLKPGGTLLIFERGPLEISNAPLSFSLIPFIAFIYSFRTPEMYKNHLAELGFRDIKVQKIDLETPFFLLTALKSSPSLVL